MRLPPGRFSCLANSAFDRVSASPLELSHCAKTRVLLTVNSTYVVIAHGTDSAALPADARPSDRPFHSTWEVAPRLRSDEGDGPSVRNPLSAVDADGGQKPG